MTKFIVTVDSTVVKKSPDSHAKKNGDLKKEQEIEVIEQQNGYGHTGSPIQGWVKMSDLSEVKDVAPHILPREPIEPLIIPGLNLHRAMHGDERPDIGWLGINKGSFDIIPLLPNTKLEKGDPLKLDAAQVAAIRKLNPDGGGFTAQQKWNWLVDDIGNRDVMAHDDITDEYRIPSPGISGGAHVNVLETMGDFAKIETLAGTIPDNLPSHLVFTWYGFADTKLFKPFGGVQFPVLFSRTSAYVPSAWLVKL